MLDGKIGQGASSTQIFEIPSELSVKDFCVVYMQEKPYIKITKEKNDCIVGAGGAGEVLIQSYLTPEDSARFNSRSIVEAQVVITTENDEIINSDIIRLRVEKGLRVGG